MPRFDCPAIAASEITPRHAYLNRRNFMAGAAGLIGGALAAPSLLSAAPLKAASSPFSTDETPTDKQYATSYNNYYEFGTGKDDPAANAGSLTTSPWTVKVDGLVNNPADYQLEDFIKPSKLEDRVYRHRCVEAWSMVIPWVGFPLSDIIKRADPKASAKYVAFETLMRPEEMPGLKSFLPVLDWPYREGLRMDEAMNPLTILAVGMYGETLPTQNGAPLRLVVPWKYGFKGAKSIVRISFVDKEPPTAWNLQAPSEYGFYSNVNPERDHPRWSQATEQVIGGGLFSARKDTLMFNGYGEQVAGLYAGMDLQKYY